MYGTLDTPHIEIPHGQLSIHVHPHLNHLTVGLSLDGVASFDAPDWKLAIAPAHFSVSAPILLNGAELHLLRGDDGEIGISFDKNSSRHFFFIGSPLFVAKFSLNLMVYVSMLSRRQVLTQILAGWFLEGRVSQRQGSISNL